MFSPGNLRATFNNSKYSKLIDYSVNEKYTLRYTRVMVPDFNQIIVKQKGIFTNVTSPTAKAKNAGGFSSDGYKSVLNKAIINVISLNLGHKGWGKSNQILGGQCFLCKD